MEKFNLENFKYTFGDDRACRLVAHSQEMVVLETASGEGVIGKLFNIDSKNHITWSWGDYVSTPEIAFNNFKDYLAEGKYQ